MTVTLTSDQEKFVADQLKSGHFQSATDVISQSFDLLRGQEEFIQTQEAELRQKINVGLDQARRGELIDGPTVIERVREKLRRQ